MLIYLGRGADLHIARLMPLPQFSLLTCDYKHDYDLFGWVFCWLFKTGF